jgi:uncharacterized membrane protein YqjE
VTTAASRSVEAPEFSEPAPKTSPPGTGVLGEVSNLFSSGRRVVAGFMDLVVLEGRRAGIALAWMLGLGLAAGLLAVTAWLGLMAMAALALMAADVSPILAILIVVVLNLAAAGGAVFVCVKKSKDLLFTASRRQIASKGSRAPTTA